MDREAAIIIAGVLTFAAGIIAGMVILAQLENAAACALMRWVYACPAQVGF